MQQSSVIFANLLIAYLLFIAARGEIPDYITLLRGGGQQASTQGGSGNGSATTNAVVSGAEQLLNNNPLSSSDAQNIIDLFGE